MFRQRSTFGEVEPLTSCQALDHQKKTTKASKWAFIRGFHIFRHSIASNLAADSVDQRVIDQFMGYQTEDARRR